MYGFSEASLVSSTSHAESPVARMVVGAAWLGLYLAIVLTPLAIVFIGPTPEGRGFWTELSVALGFVGLSTLGLQFAITGRLRPVAAPYGIDVLLQFHRQIAVVATTLVLAHPAILFVQDPRRLALFNLLEAPWPARFGVPAAVLLGVSVGLAVWRRCCIFPTESGGSPMGSWRFSLWRSHSSTSNSSAITLVFPGNGRPGLLCRPAWSPCLPTSGFCGP